MDNDKYIKVLDDGFVRLVDHMGDDSAIVQAARVSYGKGTKTKRGDRGLIRYLVRHRHTSPLEMVEFKFHIRIPMDAWRQMVRHRTANINEYSTRYSEAINSCQKTDRKSWRLQAKDNKQGSAGFVSTLSISDNLTNKENQLHQFARDVYQERLDNGIAREQARKDLPLSTYTEAYWKIDLHNLFHFLSLRMDSHAQYEIRQYANAMFELIKPVVPITCEAFEDYRLGAVTFSKQEMLALKDLINQESHINWEPYNKEQEKNKEALKHYKLSKRELEEFKKKLGHDD